MEEGGKEKGALEGEDAKKADKLEDARVRTVGSYNVLHPIYAVSYRERQGLVGGGSMEETVSNWSVDRKDYIQKGILMASYLDIYLLQEVGASDMQDLMGDATKNGDPNGKLLWHYDCAHTLHQPDRTDGVAVLWKKRKYERLYHTSIIHPNGKVSLLVKLWDKMMKCSLYVVSLHLHWRGGSSMETQLREVMSVIADLDTDLPDCLGVLVGGDFNYSYGQADALDDMIRKVGLKVADPEERTPTCNRRKLDWIFWKAGGTAAFRLDEEVKHRWAVGAVESSKRNLESSSLPPSDHTLVATTFVFSA